MIGSFESALVSAPGGREQNEDACGSRCADDTACWVLCDGLGGHRGGEIASRLAVDSALNSFDADPRADAAALAVHLACANRAVLERQRAEPELSMMRTTIVMLLADRQNAFWAHSGDSRLYRFHNGRVLEWTRDDSVPQRLADAGEIRADQIRFHEDRSRLLRSLGNKPEPGATCGSSKIEPGDAFLLASDGFWELIVETEMEHALAAARDSQSWLAAMESTLQSRLTAESDNYSAIAVMLRN